VQIDIDVTRLQNEVANADSSGIKKYIPGVKVDTSKVSKEQKQTQAMLYLEIELRRSCVSSFDNHRPCPSRMRDPALIASTVVTRVCVNFPFPFRFDCKISNKGILTCTCRRKKQIATARNRSNSKHKETMNAASYQFLKTYYSR
jgi:hypothetical protein